MKMVLNMVKKSLLTIDDELSLSTNLAHAVLRLTYINALVCGHNVFDDQAFVFLLDVGPFFENLNIQIIKQTLLNCKCCVELERRILNFELVLPSDGHIPIIFSPQNLRLRITAYRTIELHRMAS